MKRILALAAFLAMLAPIAALGQGTPTANVVSSCGSASYPAGTARPQTQDTTGKFCTGATVTPGGTQDINLKQVNGATVNVGVGAASTGTQRVTTSSDSTLGLVAGTVVGGLEFNASVIPTTTNASHAAGVAMADLQTISIGSTNSLSGIVTQVSYASKGGSTSGVVIYIWSKNPASTTCTNGSNFVANQTDNQALVTNPFLLTPALVLSAQDTTTYAANTNLVANFVNGSSNTNLYACIVSNATQTPATTTDIRLNIQGTKDQP